MCIPVCLSSRIKCSLCAERKGVPEAKRRFPKLQKGDSWTGEEGDSLCAKRWPWIQDPTRGNLAFVYSRDACELCERARVFEELVEERMKRVQWLFVHNIGCAFS